MYFWKLSGIAFVFSFVCVNFTYFTSILQAVIISLLIIFASCNNDLKYYRQTVEKANKIEVHYRNSKDTILLTPQQTEAFKKILTRDVIPKLQTKFLYNTAIDLYKDNERIGFILINSSSEYPFANFSSDSLGFGFILPYGIGMFMDNLRKR
ncbi:MAG TPA: hypothetical protein PLA68_00170 [Panacibacter sp.]|nr:hypothetical protein [Panacibacter sp.]